MSFQAPVPATRRPQNAKVARRLWSIGVVGGLVVGAALAAYPSLRVRQLIGQLRGDEHEAAGPRQALSKMLGPKSVPLFSRLLNDPDPGVRLQALEALYEAEGDAAFPQLAPLMEDYHGRIRERLVEEASRSRGPEALRLLLAASADSDAWVRQAAVSGLAQKVRREPSRSPETLYALARAVTDPDLSVASSAMGAMRALAGKDFRYRVTASPEARRAAVARWRIWWEQYRPTPAPQLPAAPRITRTDPAPEFEFKDVAGRTWRNGRLRGRPVLLHFFGTWCGTCIEEMSHLEQIHREQPDVVMLALGIAEQGPDDLKKYAEEHGITFPLALAPEAVAKAFGEVHEVPVTYVIDRRGGIRRRYDGARDPGTLRAALQDVLNATE